MLLWTKLVETSKSFILVELHINVSKMNAKITKVRLSVLHILIFAGLQNPCCSTSLWDCG